MLNGDVQPPDFEWALKTLKEAADSGVPMAHTALGQASYRVIGTKYDLEEAFRHFEKAAELGDPEGLYMASIFWYSGWLGNRDFEKAKRVLEQARDANYPEAQARIYQLALPYMPAANPDGELAGTLKALKEMADAQHNAAAAFALGNYYAGSNARGSRDPDIMRRLEGLVKMDLAMKYMKQAADAGNTSAMRFLGEHLLAKKKPVEAARWFRTGHLKHDPICTVKLAATLRDNVSARQKNDPYWYDLLVGLDELGYPEASFSLGLTLNHARGYMGRWVDWKRSVECLERFMSHKIRYGDPRSPGAWVASNRISRMCYEGGHNQPRDLEKTVYYASFAIGRDMSDTKLVGLALLHPQSKLAKERDTLIKAYGCVLYYQMQGGDRKEGGMRGTALEYLRALHGFTNAEVGQAEQFARAEDFRFIYKLLEGYKQP